MSILDGAKLDYTTSDDFDPENTHWTDVSVIGSPFEVQIDLERWGQYRHRRRGRIDPWKEGRPPEAGKNRFEDGAEPAP